MIEVMGLLIFLLLGLSTPALAVSREFHFINQLKTWTEAQSYCREMFADLATIESADDWTRVSEMVANSGQPLAWIGLYDDVKSWRWSLDNTSLYERDYGSWFVFNQHFFQETGRKIHCGSIYNGELYTYICEYEQSSLCYDETSNSYIPVSDAKSWQSAQSYCRQTYTDLASIRNQQEWDDAISSVVSTGGNWIGLSREGWKWSDQSGSTFRQWLNGQSSPKVPVCACAELDGWGDCDCNDQLPFICSAPQRKVLKVTLKTDGSVNPNDPPVQEAALKQMEEDLRGQGVNQELSLRWRKQPHGDVFNKTEQ